MKTLIRGIPLVAALISCRVVASAGSFEIVTQKHPGEIVPGGGGDSELPIVSSDGRYVLFASTANNLVGTESNTPLPSASMPRLNVFLRDRASNTAMLVSVNRWGSDGGNDDSVPTMLSTNAQYVLFESSASDLVADDTNNTSDIFIRDVINGTTTLVSVNTNGMAGRDISRNATMTPDGRYVAFVSAATDLVPRDTNGIPDVFVRDLVGKTTRLVSVGAMKPNNLALIAPYRFCSSEAPLITPDGKFVAFFSTATNLVPGIQAIGEIYVRDLVAETTSWASVDGRIALNAIFGTTNGMCYNHSLSEDGRFVAYEICRANVSGYIWPGILLRHDTTLGLTEIVNTNVCAGSVSPYDETRKVEMTPDGRFIAFIGNINGTNGSTTRAYLWDAQTGTAVIVSTNQSGEVVTNTTCDWVTIDSQARWMAFLTTSTNMVTNTLAGDLNLYFHDLQAATHVLVNANADGAGLPLDPWVSPSFSPDGRFGAFECPRAAVAPQHPDRAPEILLRDLVANTTEVISAHAPERSPLTANGLSVITPFSGSADGRFVVFVSDARTLTPGDTNLYRDIYVRDQAAGSNILVSANTNGISGDNRSLEPAISADGRYVVFSSTADDLVSGDTNSSSDVFLRDLASGTTAPVSMNAGGTGPGSHGSYSPNLSTDGRYVLFLSGATNLAAGSFSGTENLFLRDMATGTNYALTRNASGVAGALTPDGRFVAYVVSAQNQYWVWDAQSLQPIYTNSVTGLNSRIAISPDGLRVITATASGISATVLSNQTTFVIATGTPGATSTPGWRFSSDSRWFVYTQLLNGTNQVYLYDFWGGTNLLVSAGYLSVAGAYGKSDSPDISPDGRFVAFRSAAANLVPGDTNGVPGIFLFDRTSGAMTLLSSSLLGSAAANSRSLCPIFTGDGSTLLFGSWASDLVSADFNRNLDVFSYSLYYSGAIPVFYAQVSTGFGSVQNPVLTWPTLPGKIYHVQFKDDLSEPTWQEVNGGIVILGNQGWFTEAFFLGRRFYRIVASDGSLGASGTLSRKEGL